MGQQGERGKGGFWKSAAIVAAAAGYYSAVSGANNQGNRHALHYFKIVVTPIHLCSISESDRYFKVAL